MNFRQKKKHSAQYNDGMIVTVVTVLTKGFQFIPEAYYTKKIHTEYYTAFQNHSPGGQ